MRNMHQVSLQEEELLCPVCFEIFDEPKSLPDCAHNVCRKCLENIVHMNRWQIIECPVCRVKSRLPSGGVEKIPTNHFMKRVTEGLPGRKELQAMQKALQECEEEVKLNKSHLDECNRSIIAIETAQQQAEQAKKDISDHAQHLINTIQEEAIILTTQVDGIIRDNGSSLSKLLKQREKTLESIKETEKVVSDVKNIIERGKTDDLIALKDESLDKLHQETDILTNNISFTFSEFPKNIQFIKATGFSTGRQLLGHLSSAIDNVDELLVDDVDDYFGAPSQRGLFPRSLLSCIGPPSLTRPVNNSMAVFPGPRFPPRQALPPLPSPPPHPRVFGPQNRHMISRYESFGNRQSPKPLLSTRIPKSNSFSRQRR